MQTEFTSSANDDAALWTSVSHARHPTRSHFQEDLSPLFPHGSHVHFQTPVCMVLITSGVSSCVLPVSAALFVGRTIITFSNDFNDRSSKVYSLRHIRLRLLTEHCLVVQVIRHCVGACVARSFPRSNVRLRGYLSPLIGAGFCYRQGCREFPDRTLSATSRS